jgi:acyl-CoA thioester hydrolase
MSALTTERIRVRGTECDIYGHLNNANAIRLMRYVDERHPPRGAMVRHRVEFLRPAEPGDMLTISVDIADASPGYERRVYEVANSDTLLIRGSADFVERGASDAGLPVAESPPPPPGSFVITRPVEWRDVGMDGTVGIAALAALSEDAGIRVAAAHGWPMTRCSREGFAIVLRSIDAELSAPARLDDEISIETYVSDPRRSMITRHYVLTRASDGAEVCRFDCLYVWTDLDTLRPIRVPEALLADFAENFVAGSHS